ncbi:MAG TPA: exo-beta-N-acetylmuramidase NamZ domain-containing protein, partial [Gemmatimonadales bacterium]|nr:exo-beta-N-acetylmuramidase NamZ domain-containing protein [Gemmatimonadales bacterium]
GDVRDRIADPDTQFVGFLPVPMRHGLTLGELVRLAAAALKVDANLTVVPAAGWRRAVDYDATGLRWVRPSPNMPDLESALHYPGTCLFEGTNLSVGRGTGVAFQVIGAPWFDTAAVLARLRTLAGARDTCSRALSSRRRYSPPRRPRTGSTTASRSAGCGCA